MIEVYVKEITDADKSLTVIGKVNGVHIIFINTKNGVPEITTTDFPIDFKQAEEVVECMQKAMNLYKAQTHMNDDLKEECRIKQAHSAKILKSIRPVNKYWNNVRKEKLEFPYTEEYNEWREALVFTAHLLKDEYGDLFDWDKFIDDAKSE